MALFSLPTQNVIFSKNYIGKDKIEVLSKSSIKLKVFENKNKVVFKDNRAKRWQNWVKWPVNESSIVRILV